MSYQVLARKWRPQSFEELKGQTSARKTLFNAISSGRLHHALLFTGPRGTGKTSTARILAKILRCTNLQDQHKPCNECKDCVEISAGRSLDVLEIDGASNNGVDSIRELRDQVNFNPSSGSAKVYIIDEVHMLSTSAFNALLKTLEEPPSGVYFIMATTEVHKLPKTILSRCQRYDFKPVPLSDITELLKEVCQSESVSYEEEALFLIAQSGEGCVRDSLSFLDQCITFSDGNLTAETVRENIGATDINFFKSVLKSLISRDATALIKEVQNLTSYNIEPQVYLEDLVLHIKNMVLFKVDKESLMKSGDFTEVQKNIYAELSESVDLEDLYMLFDICFKGTVDLAKSFNALLLLEMTLMKAGTAPFYQELGGPQVSEPPVAHATSRPTSVTLQTKPSTPSLQKEDKAHEAKSRAGSLGGWAGFVEKVKALNPVVGAKLEVCEYKYSPESKVLSLHVSEQKSFLRDQINSPDFLSTVQNYLVSFWGEGLSVKYQASESKEKSVTPQDLKPSVQEQKAIEQTERLAKMREEVENHFIIKSLKANYKVEITEISDKED